jgi:hypothetical protein
MRGLCTCSVSEIIFGNNHLDLTATVHVQSLRSDMHAVLVAICQVFVLDCARMCAHEVVAYQQLSTIGSRAAADASARVRQLNALYIRYSGYSERCRSRQLNHDSIVQDSE